MKIHYPNLRSRRIIYQMRRPDGAKRIKLFLTDGNVHFFIVDRCMFVTGIKMCAHFHNKSCFVLLNL